MPQVEIGDSALRFGQNQRAKEDAFFQTEEGVSERNRLDWRAVIKNLPSPWHKS
jgi:hypothetical protein